MRRRFPILSVIWKCSCGICHSLNFILALLALHLTLLILLNSMERVIPLPDILTRWTVERAFSDEYLINWSRAVFDLRGGLFLEKVTISNRSTGETILTAESALVDWAILHLLTGIYPPVDELEVSRINVYLPAGYSSSGLNEPAVAIENLSIEESNGNLIIHDLQVQAGGIFLGLSGSGVFDKPSSGGNSGNVMPRIYDLIARLQRLSTKIQANLEVNWFKPEEGDQQFDLRFILPLLKGPVGDLEKIEGIASFAYSNRKIRYYRMEASGYVTALKSSENLRFLTGDPLEHPILFQLSATGKPVSLGSIPLPSNLEITLSSIGRPFHFLELARLSTSLDSNTPVVRGLFSGPHLFFSGSASPDDPNLPDLPSILHNPVKVEFCARLQDATIAYFFPNYPKIRLLEGTRANSLRLEAVFHSQPFSIDGTLFADAIHIGATDFSHLQSHLFIDRQNLGLSKAHVQISANEFATGSYDHHFPSARFSLLAMGQTLPTTLDALLGKWWLKIFTHIQAQQPAWGDVAVWGQWGNKTTIHSITDAYGEGASYRNYLIPKLKVRVRSNYDWVVMNRFEGLFEDKRILGSVAWRLKRIPGERRPMLLDFKSNAPWEAVVAASGLEVLGRYEVGGYPEVEASGIIWNPPKNNRDLGAIPDLKVRLNTFRESFNTGDLKLSNLSLSGHVGEDHIEFNSVNGKFSEGIFTGSLSIDHWKEPERLSRHLKIQLFDTNYREAVNELTKLLKNPGGIRSALIKDTTKGRADADLDLRLVPEAIFSTGEGRVTLRNADIGQIHLLGGLSRSLDGIGMGFSSLDLDAASLEWSLKDGIFNIPQCLITGPVLNLAVNGNINLRVQQIDLQANVMLFRGLASHVFAPVGESFKFDLSGNLEDPAWQLRLNPFRWFQNRLPESQNSTEL